jgi:glycogen debranching enzyme
VERDGERAELYDLLHIVHEVGPCAPDGSYARVSFDTHLPLGKGHDTPTVVKSGRSPGLTIEWSKTGECTAVARLSIAYDGVLEVYGYCPWDWRGTWSTIGEPTGCRLDARTADGESALVALLLHATVSERDAERVEVLSQGDEARTCLPVVSGDSLYVSIQLTGPATTDSIALHEVNAAQVDGVLEAAEAAYESSRVQTQGHWDGLAASITNNLHWMVSLKPETGRLYTPAGRRWIFPRHGGERDHWTVFCWDAFLNALELAVESPELARETLLAVLETQYENGNIPNWRGRFAGTPDRSQPPVASFAVLKCYLRTGDRELLKQALPYLERWSAWWNAPKRSGRRRDGNSSGLFEWGCDTDLMIDSPASWENKASKHQLAAWESGQDDLPLWDDAKWVDETETFDVESVDLNSLLALDLECLAHIARELGVGDSAVEHRAAYRNLVDRINRYLWDDTLGMYVDRSWGGRRSRRLAASNFYPLIAGIPSRDRAERMVETLLDDTRFWGRYVLPTISRDDPAFADQQYWRGTIWPPPNYLVYQGLRRYGFDEVAGELASRSADLFLETWRKYHLCRENYDSRTGEGGGQTYQSWGPLFALMAVEEFVDVNPWDGLRLGTLAPPPDSTLCNIKLCGHSWNVSVSPDGMTVAVDGKQLLQSRVPLVLRHCSIGEARFSAQTLALEPVELAISLGTNRVLVTIDGEKSETSADRIGVPAGSHRLELRAV